MTRLKSEWDKDKFRIYKSPGHLNSTNEPASMQYFLRKHAHYYEGTKYHKGTLFNINIKINENYKLHTKLL